MPTKPKSNSKKPAAKKPAGKSPAAKKPAAKAKPAVKAPQPQKVVSEPVSQPVAPAKQEEKKQPLGKIAVAAIIIVVIIVIIWALYPSKKTATVQDESAVKTEDQAKTEPSAPAQDDKAKPESDVVIYKVKHGDQLSEISKKFYGTTREWKRILEANKDKLSSPTQLKTGMELVIPGAKKQEAGK